MATEYDDLKKTLSAPELDAFKASIKAASDRFGGLSGALKALEARGKLLDQGIIAQKDSISALNRAQREYKEEVKRVNQDVKSGRLTSLEARNELEDLADNFKKAAHLMGPEAQQTVAKFVDGQNAAAKGSNQLAEYFVKFAPAVQVAGSVLSSFGRNADSIMSSGSSLDAGFALATASVGATASGMSMLGKGLQSAAPVLLALGPEMLPVVAGLSLFGLVLDVVGKATQEVAEKAMPILNKQISSLSQSFTAASSAGAMYANGITGLMEQAKLAGVDAGTFSKAIKENSESVAMFGGGMVNGARRIADVGKIINSSGISKRLQNLGFSLEEIPGLIAKTGGEIAKSGKGATSQQVADATEAYAKNLRLIASITGQDAQGRMAEQEAKNRSLRFQQEMLKMDPAQAALVNQNLAASDKIAADIAREKMNNMGQIVDQNLAIAASQFPALAKQGDELYQAMKNQTLTETTGADIKARYAQETKKQLANAEDFARAINMNGSPMGELSGKLADSMREMIKAGGPENLKEIKDSIANQSRTMDETTTNINKLAEQGMAAKVALQDLTKDALKPYTETVIKLNNVTLGVIQKFAGTESTSNADTGGRGTVQSVEAARANLEAARGASVTKNDYGQITADPETQARMDLAQAQREQRVREQVRAIRQTEIRWDQTDGEANGGIVSGSPQGFLSKLHGTEAVIPLPDGLKGNDFYEALQNSLKNNATSTNAFSQTAALPEVFQKTADNSTESNDLMRSLVDKMQELIDVSKNVASYTELTSARVS